MMLGPRTIGIVLVAVFMGASVGGCRSHGEPSASVCILAENLGANDALTVAHVKTIEVPVSVASQMRYVIRKEELPHFIGRKPLRDMVAGEVLSVHDFALGRL